MHKALILAPEHADDALATIGRIAQLVKSSQRCVVCCQRSWTSLVKYQSGSSGN
jgi:hypothetical protein